MTGACKRCQRRRGCGSTSAVGGPGGALPLSRQAAPLLLVLLPTRCGQGGPRAGLLSPGRCLSWGLLRGRPAALSGSRSRGLRLPPPSRQCAHQLPREPRPRSRPLGPYYSRRAGGGGGGARPLKSAARAPDSPAAAPRWLRLDCGQGASRPRLRPQG